MCFTAGLSHLLASNQIVHQDASTGSQCSFNVRVCSTVNVPNFVERSMDLCQSLLKLCRQKLTQRTQRNGIKSKLSRSECGPLSNKFSVRLNAVEIFRVATVCNWLR